MNTIEDIIEWLENYDNPDENIEAFAYELGEMLKDMDYTASNGGAAVGYAGVTGNYEGISTGIYLTVENIVNGSNREFSFINNGVNISAVFITDIAINSSISQELFPQVTACA